MLACRSISGTCQQDRQTDRHTDVAICTWPRLNIYFAVRQQIYAGISISGTCPQTDRQTQTDRHTDVAICTWPRLYISFAVRQQIYAGVSISGGTCPQTDRQTDRQTHGRGYMYLARTVHIVYCKAADLCWHVDLSQELVHRQTERQTDTRTWLYVPGRVCTYSLL